MSAEAGVKYDAGKPRAGLVLGGFNKALMEVAKVGTFGAEKYTPNGWKTVDPDRYRDALFRHLMQDGVDEESGLAHLAHAAWNVLALLEFSIKANESNQEAVDTWNQFFMNEPAEWNQPGAIIVKGADAEMRADQLYQAMCIVKEEGSD